MSGDDELSKIYPTILILVKGSKNKICYYLTILPGQDDHQHAGHLLLGQDTIRTLS